DGKTVATAYVDGSIAFFSAEDGKLTATMPAGIYPVFTLAFSPNGQILAGADTNRTVWLWDIASKAPLLVVSARREPTALAFAPEGSRLALRPNRGEVRVLDVSLDRLGLNQPQDVIDWARAASSAALSENDRQRFLLARAGATARSQESAGPILLDVSTSAAVAAATGDKASLPRQADGMALQEGLPGVRHAHGI